MIIRSAGHYQTGTAAPTVAVLVPSTAFTLSEGGTLTVSGTCTGSTSVEAFFRVNGGAWQSIGTDSVNPPGGTFTRSHTLIGADAGAVDVYAAASGPGGSTDSAVVSGTVYALPTVAIMDPAAATPIAKTLGYKADGAVVVSITYANATAVELWANVNSGGWVDWGAFTIAGGTGTCTRTITAPDVGASVVLKATATGAGGTVDSATVTVIIVDLGSKLLDYYDAATVVLNGSNVSQLTGKKASNHLLQSVPGSRPAWSATGSPSGKPTVHADGVATFLKTASFTWNQPALVVASAKFTWAAGANHYMLDGNLSDYFDVLYQGTGAVVITYSGTVLNYSPQPTSGTWYVYEYLANGASSANSLNGATRTTGNAGTRAPSGLTLGRAGGAASGYGDVYFARAAILSADFASANERNAVVGWCNRGI